MFAITGDNKLNSDRTAWVTHLDATGSVLSRSEDALADTTDHVTQLVTYDVDGDGALDIVTRWSSITNNKFWRRNLGNNT